jgi:hydroxymethylpyrimidine/phosphomethylpyrimidine kinase
MLCAAPIVEAVAESVARHRIGRLVVDPVMVSTGGDRLLAADALPALIGKLLPLARIVTPNLPEAEALIGRRLEGPDAIRAAAREIQAMGPRAVVIKGGHAADPDHCCDFFFDGTHAETLVAPRIRLSRTRGTGCVFSAAIAAFLARGLDALEAVSQAKAHVTAVCRSGAEAGQAQGG